MNREVLWNGNVEPPLWTVFRDRDHVIRWAWRTHGQTRDRVLALAEERPHLTIVRLRSRAEVEQWVTGALAGWCSSEPGMTRGHVLVASAH
jgi:hypothetical protein